MVVELSDVLAAIAIVVSVLSFKRGESTSKKINEMNLESGFFEFIFKEKMTKDIPAIMNSLKTDDAEAFSKRIETLDDVFVGIIEKAGFYKFFAPKFYNLLYKKIIEIDDFIMQSISMPNSLNMEKTCLEVNEKISDFYKIVRGHYFTVK